MGQIKLVVFDLDGTVLDGQNGYRNQSIETLRRLIADGVRVASVSGRSVSKSQAPFDDLPDVRKTLLVGSYNGAIALGPDQGGRRETLLERRMPEEVFRETSAFARERGTNYVYCDLVLEDGRVAEDYLAPRNDASIERMNVQTGTVFSIKPDVFDRIEDGSLGVPPKILIVPGPDDRDEILAELRRKFGDRLYMARTDRDRIEVMHPEVNKAVAIAAIAKACGVSVEDTLAIGDGDNDLPMLASAGVGALMGNANEQVQRDAADLRLEMVPSLEEEGFTAAVERFVYAG